MGVDAVPRVAEPRYVRMLLIAGTPEEPGRVLAERVVEGRRACEAAREWNLRPDYLARREFIRWQ